MDIRDLEVFRAVVREGGITRASEKIGRVQSSVTTRIKQLEAEIDGALFIRQGKKMIVTPKGNVLLDYADRIIGLADEARRAMMDETPIGPLRIGAMESTSAVRLPPILTAYAEQYPNVDLSLRTGNPVVLAQALIEGEIDAALFAEPVATEAFDACPAFVEPLALISNTGHPLIRPGHPPKKPIIVFEEGCPHRKRMVQWFEAAGAPPPRIIELGSYHAMFGSVVAGMGVALLPHSVLAAFPDRDAVRVHELAPKFANLTTYVVWRRGADSPTIQAFRKLIEDVSQKGS